MFRSILMKKEILSRLVLEYIKVTCGKLYSVCIIQDDVLAGVAVLAAKGSCYLGM